MTKTEALARLDAMVLDETRGCGFRCTPAITRAVVEWCRWMGAGRVAVEHVQPYRRTTQQGDGRITAGRLDVVASWRNGGRLAIEIDSADKSASVKKLRLAKEDGCKVLWLRWDRHNVERGCIPSDVTTHFTKIAEPIMNHASSMRDA